MQDHPQHSFRHGVWDDETIRRFWDYWATRDDRHEWYFSKSFATALIRLAEWSGTLKGRVLDYGCAHGDLCAALVKHRASLDVEAVEFSQQSLDLVDERLKRHSNWKGGTLISGSPTPLQEESFDLIYCVEVIEHLKDEWLSPTLAELYRLLKPGGTLILTTPHEENLAAAMNYCPFCSTVFHPVQHVRSIAKSTLVGWLRPHGYQIDFCQGIDLREFQDRLGIPGLADWSFNALKRPLGYWLLKQWDHWFPRRGLNRRFEHAARHTGPHLVAIARRPSD